MSNLVIAIDGPSASGKSTVSLQVAQCLNFIHVDSGSLYRGVTWYFISKGVKLGNPPAGGQLVAAVLKEMHMEFFVREQAVRFRIDSVEREAELRSKAVNDMVSPVAAMPMVREWIVAQLRKMPSFGNLVMEGRDIGTAVFRDAKFKFYLDATPAERARRRHLEMLNAGRKVTYEEVLRSILKRDNIDSSRALDPLKIAPDAVIIQSTKMTVDEVVKTIINRVSPPAALEAQSTPREK